MRVDVDMLVVARGEQAEQLAGPTLARHLGIQADLGDARADFSVERRDVRVAPDHHALRTDVPGLVTELLEIGEAHLGALAGDDLDDPTEPAGGAVR